MIFFHWLEVLLALLDFDLFLGLAGFFALAYLLSPGSGCFKGFFRLWVFLSAFGSFFITGCCSS